MNAEFISFMKNIAIAGSRTATPTVRVKYRE